MFKYLYCLIIFITFISCSKNGVDNGPIVDNNQNISVAPTGFKLDSSFLINGKPGISISWDPISDPSYKFIKIYRGVATNTESLIATINATEKKFLDTSNIQFATTYYYKVSAINSKDKESPLSTQAIASTPSKVERNAFALNGITNLVLAEQTTNIFEYGNVLALDSNGNSASLKIPDAKSYNLSVNYMVPCTKTLLYLNGSLTVQYNSGKVQSFRNFILDTKSGNFYQLENDFGALWSRTGPKKTPWVNGTIQYDANENIYILTNSGALIQEITKFGFQKTTDSTIRVSTTAFNLIGESYYFNYNVLPTGDIIYMNKENMMNMVWKTRSTSGSISDIPGLTHMKPFTIGSTTYFVSVNTSKCFVINDSKGQSILFVNGNLEDKSGATPVFGGSTLEMYMPFYIKINAGNVTFIPVGDKYFNSNIITNPGPLQNQTTLFTDYYHGMWYFPQGANHIFTNRGYGGDGQPSTWWKYNDTKNTIDVSYLPYSPPEFSTYSNLLTRSYDNAFVVIKRDIYNINLSDLSYSKTAALNYQIYLTSYVGDGRVQFYGISYLTGNKVLGEFNKNGTVKLIKEFDNAVTVKDIVKIGTF
jgi:hypothetical protein